MQEDRLQKIFQFVKNNYFPGWDKKGKWKVEDCSEELNAVDSTGRCDRKTKTIKINMSRMSEDEDGLYVLLTHEMCHCHNLGHGESWKNLMFKAADRAWRLGHFVLSSLISTDVHHTVTSESLTRFRLETKIYGWVSECIDEDPNIPFDEFINRLVEKYGVPKNMSEEWIKICERQYDYKKKATSSVCNDGLTPENCDHCEKDTTILNIPSPPTPEQFCLTEEQINYFKTIDEKKPGFIIKLFSIILFIVGFVIFGFLINPNNFVQFILVIVCAGLCMTFCKTLMLSCKEIILNHRIKKIKTTTPYQDFLNFEKALKDHKEEFKDSYGLQSKIYLNEIRKEKKRRKLKITVVRRTDWWEGIDGTSFELEVAKLLMSKNYNVRHVGSSYGDGGVDLVVKSNDKTIIVQCKAYKNYVNPAIVRELYGTLIHQDADEAWLIVTSGFYKGAKDFALGKPIRLLKAKDLIKLPHNKSFQKGSVKHDS